jgi:hypothetical protein
MAAATLAFKLAQVGAGKTISNKIIEEETGGDKNAMGVKWDELQAKLETGGDRPVAYIHPPFQLYISTVGVIRWVASACKLLIRLMLSWKVKVCAPLAPGGPLQQATGIALYRVTPHPFSASNYLFGLTKLKLGPYVAGTAARPP